MFSINNNSFNCNDCRWNFLCSLEEQNKRRNKCAEFELDVVMSDTYADILIERKKKEFIRQWRELFHENYGAQEA